MSGPTCLRIDGEMTIYRAAELKPVLLEALKPSADMDIDLSGVTEFDSAGVQLLMLAQREARAMQGELRLVAPSAAVREVFDLLDLAAAFGASVQAA